MALDLVLDHSRDRGDLLLSANLRQHVSPTESVAHDHVSAVPRDDVPPFDVPDEVDRTPLQELDAHS
jgi:hypothetical protein